MFYTDAQLLELVTAPESSRLERKQSFADKDKICRTLCAFANDLAGHGQAGVVMLGVADDGSVTGIDASDTLLQKIDQIHPRAGFNPCPA